MTFDYEQKEFPSAVHQAIWNCIRNLFPLEKSLQNIAEEPLRSDCISYYRCFRDTYEDMYEHPEQYYIPVAEISFALNGTGFRQAIISTKWHNDKQREKALQLIGRVRFLDMLRFRLCVLRSDAVTSEGDRLVMSEKDAKKMMQAIGRDLRLKPNDLLALFQKRGFCFTFDNENCYLNNTDYPGVMRLMMRWREKCHSQKVAAGNPYLIAYAHADFRALLPDYQCSFEDAITPMYEDQKRLLRMLDDALQEMKICPKCSLYSASYVKKGKQMLAYGGNYEHLYASKFADERYLRVPLAQYPSEDHTLFEAAVQEHPDAEKLISFIFRHLILCKKCGCHGYHSVPPALLGRPTPLFGKTKRLCAGNVVLGFSNLQKRDIPLILELIRIKYDVMQRNNRKVSK